MLLAIETSCDETSVAIIDRGRFADPKARRDEFLRADLIASQTDRHEIYGGVVPELAAREHLANLPQLVEEAFRQAGIGADQITAVAVTRGPGLNGCLLVGLSFAKAFALSRSVPLLPLNHLEGHLFASALSDDRTPLPLPALVLLVSGGHTELLHVKAFRQYELVARTKDDAVGEAFDKSATLLGLPYPGGPALARCAERGNAAAFSFPIGMADDDSAFSFSGVKTAVRREVERCGDLSAQPARVCDLAASIEKALVDALLLKTRRALDRLSPAGFLLTGGVAANQRLQTELGAELNKRKLGFFLPPKRWCTDNAAMIGALGASVLQAQPDAGSFATDAVLDAGALPRWPLADFPA